MGVASFASASRARISSGFSILGGSSVGVACHHAGGAPADRRFSILGGSSVGVADRLFALRYDPDVFQYPRRIECGCGEGPLAYPPALHPGFSILGGSSVGVAFGTYRPSFLFSPRFSILGGSSVGVAAPVV